MDAEQVEEEEEEVSCHSHHWLNLNGGEDTQSEQAAEQLESTLCQLWTNTPTRTERESTTEQN